MDPIEQELRKMAEDPDLPPHLRLGVLKQLVALRGSADEPKATGSAVLVPARPDGLPTDPLLEDFPPTVDEGGRVLPADPMADLDWCRVVGRMPHALYAKVLYVVASEDKKTLVAAEQKFLREARNRGFDTEADEVADARRRRRRRDV